MPTPQGPELHLDLSILQKSVLHNDISSSQGLEPHLDMSTVQSPLQHLDVSIPKGPELYLDILSSSSVLVAFPFGILSLVLVLLMSDSPLRGVVLVSLLFSQRGVLLRL
jgi:hypothetical protein